jgi:hypothetical protein
MFSHFSRVATAAAGAFILSAMSVLAAVGPAQTAGFEPAVYAQVHDVSRAHG